MEGPVRIQTVRYGGEDGPLLRFVGSVAAAVNVARDRLGLDAVSFALGDCGSAEGPGATLPADVVDKLAAVVGQHSIDRTSLQPITQDVPRMLETRLDF